jgi:peptide/nickel transport system permease protein
MLPRKTGKSRAPRTALPFSPHNGLRISALSHIPPLTPSRVPVVPMSTWKRFKQDKAALACLAVIALVVAAALLAPLISPFNPYEQFFDGLTLEGAPLAPNAKFWLGTDLLGRDLLSRVIYGARTSLIVGLLANGAAVLIGAALGVIAGYLHGTLGGAIMRFTDLVTAFPALLLAIALAAILGRSLFIVAAVIAMVNWTQLCRVIYAETTGLAERDYVEAARALGAGTPRILWQHLLPHLLPTILVYATLGIATTVMLEAMLSFLGVGVQPPEPSWGNIVFESQSYFLNAPWLVFFPGAAIMLVALSFNVVGDALREALDPTQRGRT